MPDGPKTEVIPRVRRPRRDDADLTGTLSVLEGPDVGAFYVLQRDVSFTMGRSEDCEGSFPHTSVSRRHAVLDILFKDERLRARLRDLGSTNGVRVNRRPADEHWLASGDKLRLGRVLLRFEWMNEEEVAYHKRLAESHRVAQRDPLSGLYTRAFLDDRLPKLIIEADEEFRPLSCILLDLDRFKAINDEFGHLIGDGVIRRVARVAWQTLRRADFAIRYGGEEMLFILPDVNLEGALEIAEQLRESVARDPFSELDAAVRVTASLGVSERGTGESAKRWIGRTDQALYDAKRGGRNRVVQAPHYLGDLPDPDSTGDDLAKETVRDVGVVSVEDEGERAVGEIHSSGPMDTVDTDLP